MSDGIQCIDAYIYKNDDGTMDCCWLDPYIGDITAAEYHDRGTALGVRRGCEYCMAMLEWETRCEEEDWGDSETVCDGQHPDWPGEICAVNRVVDSSGKLIGYETQHKLYSSLHELEFHGWELQYGYYSKGKQIYKEESDERRCLLMGGCGTKESVQWCSINHGGQCCLDTASFEEMDRLADRCGFIRVNNRYLMWKYGVPYKDLDCRNCEYYSAGAYSHGVCTNDKVEPSPMGVTVNGQKEYIESKERYEGAKACKEFVKKKEGEEVAKGTYWTKCGRQFEKNSTAVVTGYTVDKNGQIKGFEKCVDCPFPVSVTVGYPAVHDRWECRAGSKEPNHTNDWIGSVEDKNTIGINSLDNNFLESIIEYCKGQPDVSAGYNADHLADCRRTLSISCSSNKKGIAAKKALIEKFFPKVEAVPDERYEADHCEDCSHLIDDGTDLDGYAQCNYKHRRMAKDHEACAEFEAVQDAKLFDEQKCRVCGCTEDNACKGGCYWVEDDLCSRCAEMGLTEKVERPSCDQDDCPFNDREGNCVFEDEDPESDGYHRDVIGAVDGWKCRNETLLQAYKVIANQDSCDIDDESDAMDLEDQLDILLANGDSEDKAAKDRELLLTLIGKEIRTHYNTGGIVFNISGPHTAYGPGSWSINYSEDGKKHKNFSIINSIKVENGVITCEGKPLRIIELEKESLCEESPKSSGSGSCASGTEETGVTSTVDKPAAMTAQGLKEEKEEIAKMKCNIGKCLFNNEAGGCGFDINDIGNSSFREYAREAIGLGCKNEALKEAFEKNENACPHRKLSCDCPAIGLTKECDVIRRKDWDRYYFVKEMEKYNIDCDIYMKLAAEIIAEKKPEKAESVNEVPKIVTESLENVSETANITTFDYSTVDEETAGFLQEKANKITEIRIKSVIALGKEFKEAQDKLSNNKTGTFGAWSQSLGFSRQTVQNYVQAYDYIVKNFDNIESADNIQPSLLFAASKPSAPKELSEKVASGDITTHKQYKELEARLKEEEKIRESVQKKLIDVKWEAEKTETQLQRELRKTEATLKDQTSLTTNLKQQLDQAKRNGDPAKVKELGKVISVYQQEVENYQQQIGSLNLQLQEKNRELKDKPIEVAAARVVEKVVIPEEVRNAIYSKVAGLYEGILKLTETEIQIFAENVDPDYSDEICNGLKQAFMVLKQLDNAVVNAQNVEQEAALASEPCVLCGACRNADMDAVTEEQLDEGKTWCKLEEKVMEFTDGCSRYEGL
jgi:hypothetical protein